MAYATRSVGYIAGTALLFGGLLAGPVGASAANHAQSLTRHANNWTITLKLLPAEQFTHVVKPSTRGEMHVLAGPGRPLPAGKANHHLVVFLQHDGRPATNAKVTLQYRLQKPHHAAWRNVPVVRMDVAGKGVQTTHYGNNVLLKPGRYEFYVTVNGKLRKRFELDVD